jgi:hypothetical protein
MLIVLRLGAVLVIRDGLREVRFLFWEREQGVTDMLMLRFVKSPNELKQ